MKRMLHIALNLPSLTLNITFPFILLGDSILVEGCLEDVDRVALASWLVDDLADLDLGWSVDSKTEFFGDMWIEPVCVNLNF